MKKKYKKEWRGKKEKKYENIWRMRVGEKVERKAMRRKILWRYEVGR